MSSSQHTKILLVFVIEIETKNSIQKSELAKKYLQNDKFVSNRSCAMPTKCLTFNNICAGRVFVIFRWETICYIFSAATASQATNGAEVREQQNEQSLRNNTETKTGKSL